MDNIIENEKMPKIYCAICILFDKESETDLFSEALNQIGIHDFKIRFPKYSQRMCYDMAIVNNEEFWYLDEALAKMFQKVDGVLPQLKEFVDEFKGKIFIDIAFYQYGKYPALLFSGDNMKKIRFLEADISIDPYDFSD